MMARETAARVKLFMVLVSGICDAVLPLIGHIYAAEMPFAVSSLMR